VLTLGALHLFRFGFAVGTAQVIAVFTAKYCYQVLLPSCCQVLLYWTALLLPYHNICSQ